MSGERRWCDECGVDWGLHNLADDEEPTPADCRHASTKADLLVIFGGFR